MKNHRQFYNKIINNIAKGVKETLTENIQNFDVTQYEDDSIIDHQTINDALFPVKSNEDLQKLVAERIKSNPEHPYLLDINVSEIIDFSCIFAAPSIYNDPWLNSYIDHYDIHKTYNILDIHTWDMSDAKIIMHMFKNCPYNYIILPDNISNVFISNNVFEGCKNLRKLDLSSFDTSKVTDMSYMFKDCKNLRKLDISHFNVENVENMSNMFKGCSALTTLNMFKSETSSLKDMSEMFEDCMHLKSLDISSITTDKLQNVGHRGITCGCKNLSDLKLSEDLAKFIIAPLVTNVEIINI